MTLKASDVLADCERLLSEFDGNLQKPIWRAQWVGLVALLRAVGHVLAKVDVKASVAARVAIDEAWSGLQRTKPEPRIFWQFIETERNNVLKAYAFAPGVNVTLRLGAVWSNVATGESGSSPGGPASYEPFMSCGPFKGREPTDLCREAIDFWREYLDGIERTIKGVRLQEIPGR
jgi:hypothetical protein